MSPESTLVLTPIYDRTLVLTSEEDTSSIELVAADDLVLQIAQVAGGGGSGVSGPDIYAFAAAYG